MKIVISIIFLGPGTHIKYFHAGAWYLRTVAVGEVMEVVEEMECRQRDNCCIKTRKTLNLEGDSHRSEYLVKTVTSLT